MVPGGRSGGDALTPPKTLLDTAVMVTEGLHGTMQRCPHHAMDGQVILVPKPRALWASRELITQDCQRQPSSPLALAGSWLTGVAASARNQELSSFSIFWNNLYRWELPDPPVGWNSFVKALKFEALRVCVLSWVGVEGVFQSFLVLFFSPHQFWHLYFFPTENVSISPRPQTHSYRAVVGCTAVLNLYVCLSCMCSARRSQKQSPDSWGTQGLWRGMLRGQVLTAGGRQD